MVNEALIERLENPGNLHSGWREAMREAAAGLKAAEAELVDTKQLLDRACEVNIQIQAERDKAEAALTAARAEIERLTKST